MALTNLTVIADHDLDLLLDRYRLLDRDRLADRGSHVVAHNPLSRSLVVVHTNLITDHDPNRLLNREFFLDRLIANVIVPSPVAPSTRLAPFARRTLTRYHRSYPV